MKAIVCPGYGPPDVLELQDVDKPVVKDNEPSRGALKNLIRPRLAAPVPMGEGGPCSVR